MTNKDSIADWMRNYDQRLAKERAKARNTMVTLCDQLAELGVETIHIEYDGCGESGAFEQVQVLSGENEIELAANFMDDLEAAAEALLPDGWENNEGAFGALTIHVAERRMTREHNWRVVSAEYEVEEWSP